MLCKNNIIGVVHSTKMPLGVKRTIVHIAINNHTYRNKFKYIILVIKIYKVLLASLIVCFMESMYTYGHTFYWITSQIYLTIDFVIHRTFIRFFIIPNLVLMIFNLNDQHQQVFSLSRTLFQILSLQLFHSTLYN